MRLVGFLHGLKVFHLHVKRFLILAEALCPANQFGALELVAINRFDDIFDRLCLIQVLRSMHLF